MSKKLNLSGMLDFTEIDLTAPDKVVEEIMEEAHNTIVDFKLDKYVYTRKAIEIVKGGGVE